MGVPTPGPAVRYSAVTPPTTPFVPLGTKLNPPAGARRRVAREALRTLEPSVGTASLAALGVSGTNPVDVVLPPLINELAALDRRVVLVLEDYHLIQSPDVHEGVAFLLERLPPTLELVIATRLDPPLPLARLRA